MSGGEQPVRVAPVVGYALFDFANSAYSTVITTFIFATYFASGIAADPVTGAAQWSLAIAVSGVVIALVSPIFGAIADQTGRRLPWIGVLTSLSVVATAS